MSNLNICQRLFLTTLLCLVITPSHTIFGNSKKSQYRYTSVPLRIRKSAGTDAKKIGLIPKNTKVLMLNEEENSVTISGVKGKWTLVKWKKKTGWVFGGFLSLTRIKKLKKSFKVSDKQLSWELSKKNCCKSYLKLYLNGKFKAKLLNANEKCDCEIEQGTWSKKDSKLCTEGLGEFDDCYTNKYNW